MHLFLRGRLLSRFITVRRMGQRGRNYLKWENKEIDGLQTQMWPCTWKCFPLILARDVGSPRRHSWFAQWLQAPLWYSVGMTSRKLYMPSTAQDSAPQWKELFVSNTMLECSARHLCRCIPLIYEPKSVFAKKHQIFSCKVWTYTEISENITTV